MYIERIVLLLLKGGLDIGKVVIKSVTIVNQTIKQMCRRWRERGGVILPDAGI